MHCYHRYINQRTIDSSAKYGMWCTYNLPGLYMVRNINTAVFCNNYFDFHSNINIGDTVKEICYEELRTPLTYIKITVYVTVSAKTSLVRTKI